MLLRQHFLLLENSMTFWDNPSIYGYILILTEWMHYIKGYMQAKDLSVPIPRSR